MRLTRRTAVTVLSTLYLLALTILGAYALHSTRLYTLPIPSLLTALTVALPPLAGIALETTISLNSQLAAKNKLSRSNAFLWVIAVLLVYETVVVTLAGTHLYPGTSGGGWKCGLEAVWQRLYSAHDESPIRVIQDAFECCGLNSVRDRAYPFQNRNGHGAEACLVRFERTQRCLDPWRAEERKVAVMLLVVPIAVFVWKVCDGAAIHYIYMVGANPHCSSSSSRFLWQTGAAGFPPPSGCLGMAAASVDG